ncbi:hypothetical protein FGO68_gene3480 [Halteria grandinella]|uniref:Uncharacterized protein n=1 Tax=Halteria grandinella TaxID=5974 RepID=A0A8J8P1A2_HALGN|nr:hypothetical protein FGO68_gene3480 [Halteria grandinella]
MQLNHQPRGTLITLQRKDQLNQKAHLAIKSHRSNPSSLSQSRGLGNIKADPQRPLINITNIAKLQREQAHAQVIKLNAMPQCVPDTPEINAQLVPTEEDDDYARDERFAKTELYQERCVIFFEALAQVNLALDSFAQFSNPTPQNLDMTDSNINDETAAEDAKVADVSRIDNEIGERQFESPMCKSDASKKRVSICLDHEIIELDCEPRTEDHQQYKRLLSQSSCRDNFDRSSLSSLSESRAQDKSRFGFKRRNLKLLGKQLVKEKTEQSQNAQAKEGCSELSSLLKRKQLTIPISPRLHHKERPQIKTEFLNNTQQQTRSFASRVLQAPSSLGKFSVSMRTKQIVRKQQFLGGQAVGFKRVRDMRQGTHSQDFDRALKKTRIDKINADKLTPSFAQQSRKSLAGGLGNTNNMTVQSTDMQQANNRLSLKALDQQMNSQGNSMQRPSLE